MLSSGVVEEHRGFRRLCLRKDVEWSGERCAARRSAAVFEHVWEPGRPHIDLIGKPEQLNESELVLQQAWAG